MKKVFLILFFYCLMAITRAWADSSSIISVKVEIDSTAPKTLAVYDNLWHNNDFAISLTASDAGSGVADMYYKINNGSVQTAKSAGHPVISIEGVGNSLEYWSVDKAGNEELPHNSITAIKLDKTAPSIRITSPVDEAAFDAGPITVNGTVSDTLSGVKTLDVRVKDDMYNPAVQPDGSFSISGVSISGGSNSVTAVARDNADNEGADEIIVFLGWVLHLKAPYHNKEQDHYSGAASCQIVLNYIRDGLTGPLTQDEIYNYGHPRNYEENLNLPETDPNAIDYALGHFDPYDSEDPTGQGDIHKAYNFSINVFGDNDFNKYLRDIVHWMAYPVTIDKWWLGGDLTAWPNTPAIVPSYGTYNHWIVVNGASASQNPTPEPREKPWYTPDFTVYGLWLTDPTSGGIGRDLYVTAQAAQDTYLRPLVTFDRYNGKYLQVAEPPEVESEAEIDIARPKVNDETRKVIEIARQVNASVPDDLSEFEKRLANAKKHVYDAGLVVNIKDDVRGMNSAGQPLNLASVFDAGEKSAKLNWKKIIDSAILTDENFKNAFDGAQARSFIKVRRSDRYGYYYYLVPFDKYVAGQFLTYAAIIIDSEDGSFAEASWTKAPTRFVQINREKAEEILLLKYPNMRNQALCSELIWEPGNISNSPFYPYWNIVAGGGAYFVTQNREVIDAK